MQCCKWTVRVLAFVLVIICFAAPVFGAVPGLITYQGRLDDSTGAPVADGNYTMRFYLYDAETGGRQLWNPDDGEEQEVAVSQGLFNVHLGKQFPVDSRMFDTGGAWLEIAVYNNGSQMWETLNPRQQVTAAAYALKAGDADTLEGKPAGAFALTNHGHDTVYVNEGQAGAVTSAMVAGSSITTTHLADHAVTGGKILDNSITAADLAPGAVTGSELADQAVTAGKIQWSIDYTGSDTHGGILSLTNVADASSGNYPMGVYGSADGDPLGEKPVIGVFGGSPGFVSGSAITLLPVNRIGVGGSSDTGYGVAGVTHSGTGVSGTSDTGTGGYFSSSGLNGNALRAHNDHAGSTDAAVVISSDGTGPLLKGFGGNGGEDEFRIDNDGTMRFFNSSHVETVRISPSQDGSGRVVTQVLEITGGSDLSEQFDITDERITPAPGMVVSIDPDRPGHLAVSRMAYDNKVAGIISGAGGINSGMIMGQKGSVADGQHPVALTGRVYCRADAASSAIRPGDLLTTSDLPGHAMKVTDHGRANGAILGKAMTSLDKGTGLVLVLVSLQ